MKFAVELSTELQTMGGHLTEEDYYYNEQGLLVFTSKYHLKRGFCCNSGCKHCPYGKKHKK